MQPAPPRHPAKPRHDLSAWRMVVSCLAVLGSAAGLMLLPPVGRADAIDHVDAVRHVAETRIQPWMHSPIIVDAVRRQNDVNRTLTPIEIHRLDTQWRQETISADRPLIGRVLSTDLPRFLREIQAENRGLFTEIFVVDNRGLNVGVDVDRALDLRP